MQVLRCISRQELRTGLRWKSRKTHTTVHHHSHPFPNFSQLDSAAAMWVIADRGFFTRGKNNLGRGCAGSKPIRLQAVHLAANLLKHSICGRYSVGCVHDAHKEIAVGHEMQLDTLSSTGCVIQPAIRESWLRPHGRFRGMTKSRLREIPALACLLPSRIGDAQPNSRTDHQSPTDALDTSLRTWAWLIRAKIRLPPMILPARVGRAN